MEARVVASFRAVGGPGRPFLERARALLARLHGLGGVHVGWDVMKITFAFEAARFPAVLEAAMTPGPETRGDEPLWAVGIAQGDIRPVQAEGSALLESGLLWWGPPIVAASALSTLARPGEILCAQTIPALRSGELVTSGLRIARDGTLRVRGARVDKRQPWRRQAGENLARMVTPRLVTAHLPKIALVPGSLVVLRAEPGGGGSRALAELATRVPRALVIRPVGSGLEPLGALRRALARSIGREVNPHLLELAAPLEALLAGHGVSLELAVRLVTAFLWPKQSGTQSAIVLDDAKAIDAGTLEACVRATVKSPTFGMIVRLDVASALPSVLATVPNAGEHELPALSREGSEDVAVGAVGGALDALARGRWARLGAGNPLAITEAITQGIASGDLAWSGDRATPRSRAAGRGKARPAAKWIRQRANAEKTAVRAMLSVLAVAGGEARTSFLARVLELVGLPVDATATAAYLERARWVVVPQEGWIAFPSRTHHEALFSTLEGDARSKLHVAFARAIEETEGIFGRVEAAWHAAQAGDGVAAAKATLDAARLTAEGRLGASTAQLVAFARRSDPGAEQAALEILAAALSRVPSAPPPPRSMPPTSIAPMTTPTPSGPPTSRNPSMPPLSGPARIAAIASVPPTRHAMSAPPAPVASSAPVHGEEEPDSMVEHARIVPPMTVLDEADLVPDEEPSTLDEPVQESVIAPSRPSVVPPPPNAPGNQIAERLGDLAREALLAADNTALARWVEGLRATGESTVFADRMSAMARLGRGDIGDALRVLRRARAQLDPGDHRRRCQTSLALGVALSVAGRPQEALLEAMDALARARQTGDERGAKACLAFLAKLYSSVQRDAEAELLRAASI